MTYVTSFERYGMADGVFIDDDGRPDLLDLVAFGGVEPDPPHLASSGSRIRRHPVLPR